MTSGRPEYDNQDAMNPDDLETRLWQELADVTLSPSHDRWHVDRVLGFALQLHSFHGGALDVITAATILHDVGRADEDRMHGTASIEASTEFAETILNRIGYASSRLAHVITAIREHDQPAIRPSTIEGRILKDADFLAGFGAWGILRIAMWSGETGRDIPTVLERLELGMARRLDSLEFRESTVLAHRELGFAKQFLARLRLPPMVSIAPTSPYVILEGISGSGKDTQARLVAERLAILRPGIALKVVVEPHGDYRAYKHAWNANHAGATLSNRHTIKWLMMADRQQQIDDVVNPALQAGALVLSVRSYLSTIVYQATDEVGETEIAAAHHFVPSPDAVILLDLPADVAKTRIGARDQEKGDHESLEQLAAHRERYRTMGAAFFGRRLHMIDATQPTDAITEQILEIITTLPGVHDAFVAK
jgi:dTMP kinase